ncbi:large ribosomal subunit protein uL2m [Onthophagus taurus]|uniref:large ribosomal subunit protein uL2m n=1 Tax=Onthophagus taurus TaxID=166361 RepID=UPI000C2002F0|nr:39S ribosomal protein L2, mitochondrial [Onthophagus taurus]
MAILINALQKLSLIELPLNPRILPSVRCMKWIIKPEIGKGVAFRRKIHYPKEYTVKPLEVTNLGGRDPETGRMVVRGIGGGIKHKYHWIQWQRYGPKDESEPIVEKVIKILKDGCRTSLVALVARDDEMRYILAPHGLKEGDLIRTSSYIPRIPVRANIGDAFPLGALPIGIQVHCVEKYPGLGGFLVHAAGSAATITRKDSNNRVVIQLPSKREFSLPENCMCTVGRLSNITHNITPIGTAQKNRELGNRPRSGLWQRKTGRFGRKIRQPPALRTVVSKEKQVGAIRLTLPGLP